MSGGSGVVGKCSRREMCSRRAAGSCLTELSLTKAKDRQNSHAKNMKRRRNTSNETYRLPGPSSLFFPSTSFTHRMTAFLRLVVSAVLGVRRLDWP
ncbi:hypothetical protein VUR80DRAFT_3029 [Thermomyces stellatus]